MSSNDTSSSTNGQANDDAGTTDAITATIQSVSELGEQLKSVVMGSCNGQINTIDTQITPSSQLNKETSLSSEDFEQDTGENDDSSLLQLQGSGPLNIFSDVINIDDDEIVDKRKPRIETSPNFSSLEETLAAANKPWFAPRSSIAMHESRSIDSNFADDLSMNELEYDDSGSSAGMSSLESDSSHGYRSYPSSPKSSPDKLKNTEVEIIKDSDEASSDSKKDSQSHDSKLRERLNTEDTTASTQTRRRREKRLKPVQIPQPSNFVKMNKKNKKQESDFHPLLHLSTISNAHDGPIWAAEFSKDGKYLATAGKDAVIKIWEIAPERKDNSLSSLVERFGGALKSGKQKKNKNEDEFSALAIEIEMIHNRPLQTYRSHKKDIVDLSWSSTGFLISGSLDKTAKLWHPSVTTCLHSFKHPDAVTSVCFHPKEDRYFLTGGFDKKIRVWNIPNGRVAGWAPTPNAITACRYHLDGNSIAAGILDGRVFIYTIPQTNEPNKLKLSYHTQITTKQKVKKQGKKVTGLSFLQNLSDDKVVGEPKSPHAKRKSTLSNAVKYMKNVRKKKKVQQQLLVTTNDSRLRLVGLKDFCMVRKYKGHSNTSLQIKARFSESGEFIICGSETKGACVIWNTATRRNPLNVNVTGLKMYDKVKGNEWFQATETQIVTDAMFFPSASCKTSILNSGLFPTIHSLTNINHDFSAAAILTCDYEGSIRVFMRKSCFDQVSHAAGPSGYLTP